MPGRPDRSGERMDAKLAARRLDDPDVRALLDDLDEPQLWRTLGEPLRVTRYAEPLGHWRQGNQRPALADESPAVMQAVGRCAAARIRATSPLALAGPIHRAPCGWCGREGLARPGAGPSAAALTRPR